MVSWQQLAKGPVLTAPGPQGGQMLRAINAIRRDPMRYLEQTARQYGPVAQFPVPVPPSYLVSSATGAQHVLVTNARNYGKKTIQYSALSLVTGEGLLTADTEAWRPRRRILQPAFHHASIALVQQHIDRAIAAMVADFQRHDGEVVDVDAAMMHAALDIVGGALFGTDLSGDAADLAHATLAALDVVVARARMPLAAPSWVPTPNNLKLKAALRKLDAAVTKILEGRKGPLPDEPRDMLDLLLAAHSDDVSSLTARQVRDEIVTFIVAGHETVASALTWAWHLLTTHPQAYQRLQDEADMAVESTWAAAVLDEALRLYPPAWLITRHAVDADVVDGVSIPAGALIILSPWSVHRDGNYWPNAESFDPERFVTPLHDRSAYFPFGNGPRLCIGRDMALFEGRLILQGLARAVRFESVGQKVEAEPLVTIRPKNGLHLRVHMR